MATYKEIENYIKEKNGFTVKGCWIADVKDKFGILTRISPRRKGKNRKHPCPKNKEKYIIEALRYFKMIK